MNKMATILTTEILASLLSACSSFRQFEKSDGTKKITVTIAPGTKITARPVIPVPGPARASAGVGTLYAVGNYAEQVKPAPDSGFVASLQILANLAVSDTSDVTLQVREDSYLTEALADTLYLQIDNNLSEIAAAASEAQKAARNNIVAVGSVNHTEPDENGNVKVTFSVTSVNGETGAVTVAMPKTYGGVGTYVLAYDFPDEGWIPGAFVPGSNLYPSSCGGDYYTRSGTLSGYGKSWGIIWVPVLRPAQHPRHHYS